MHLKSRHLLKEARSGTTAAGRAACSAIAIGAMLFGAPVFAGDGATVTGAAVAPSTGAGAAAPAGPEARRRAPNILLIMTDDVGFSASSAFGGPVPTPTFDGLARSGLRYNNFHTTGMCSPSRAALLTGRNQHNVGLGKIMWMGYEGYTSSIPKTAGMIPEILRQNGYSTAAFGKWHLTPIWEQGTSGPYDHWPTGEGFDHFYGFIEGDTSQWNPTLVVDTKPVDPAAGNPGYHLDEGMATDAIRWIGEHEALAPDKPFFIYYATGTSHAPHHAPRAWIERFRGTFDQGWDRMRSDIFARQKKLGIIPANTKLTPRPAAIPAWSTLPADQRRLFAREMEVYAAALAHADHQIGRVIDYLREQGQLDDTLIIFIQGDNGASAEGGPTGAMYEATRMQGYEEDLQFTITNMDKLGGPEAYNTYPAGWGWAMNTPFQFYKQVGSHYGGTTNGLVISWPGKFDGKDQIRNQFHYITDIAPTIYEAAGITPPESLDGIHQMPIDGISMKYSFDDDRAPSARRMQYFEMQGNAAIFRDGWVAATTPTKNPWDYMKPSTSEPTDGPWELYDTRKDFSQADDVAAKFPDRLKELQRQFWAEAGRNHVLPITGRMMPAAGAPSSTAGRTSFFYPRGMRQTASNAFAPVGSHSFRVECDVALAPGKTDGVIIAHGGRFGGWAFYIENGRPKFHYNALGPHQYSIVAARALPMGPHRLSARITYDDPSPGSPAQVEIYDGESRIGSGTIGRTLGYFNVNNSEGADIGFDSVTPVTDDYRVEDSAFQGEMKGVTIDLLS
jgi:arylsulfatase